MPKLERLIETILFQSRWMLAPFYLGLAFCLLLMLFHFVRELVHFVVRIPAATESDVILGVLALIDITFTANLVLIVIFSGYENFVSKIEAGDHDRPDWMTKVDFGGLKQKLMTSIVAISTPGKSAQISHSWSSATVHSPHPARVSNTTLCLDDPLWSTVAVMVRACHRRTRIRLAGYCCGRE